MLLEAMGKPIKYRLRDGRELLLTPGRPVDMPDKAARYLLEKAPHRVRVHGANVHTWPVSQQRIAQLTESQDLAVETCGQLSPVFWVSRGRIVGPGRVLAIAKTTDCAGGRLYWLCIEWNTAWRWISHVVLRSEPRSKAQQQGEADIE
jgi:hypothetical protein